MYRRNPPDSLRVRREIGPHGTGAGHDFPKVATTCHPAGHPLHPSSLGLSMGSGIRGVAPVGHRSWYPLSEPLVLTGWRLRVGASRGWTYLRITARHWPLRARSDRRGMNGFRLAATSGVRQSHPLLPLLQAELPTEYTQSPPRSFPSLVFWHQ